MNILLVYPKFPVTFWSFSEALKFIGKKSAMPPLGLLSVAALLPYNLKRKLIDLNIETLKDEDINWANIIFISAMIIQKKSVIEVIDQCKKINPAVKIVAGGPLFTLEKNEFKKVDYFVLNEAEITLPLFFRDIEIGKPEKIYSSNEFCDIKKSPMPDWGLIKLKLKHYGSVSLQLSRGCPFDCEFCDIAMLAGRIPRCKTAGQIIAELNYLRALGWRRSVFFADDNLIANAKELKANILPALIRWRKNNKINSMSFYTQASINLSKDDELMDLMVEAGFATVFVGIETIHEKSLMECNKNQNINIDILESVKKMQRKGLQVQGGFIIGFDNDPPTIFQDIINFIQISGIVTAMVGPLQALKGTRLYQRLKNTGRISNQTSGDNTDGSSNIIPLANSMSIKTLKDGYKKIVQKIYSIEQYYERIKIFLRNYPPPKIKTQIEFMHIMAFFRAIYYLGIKDQKRVHYWKLIFWTLFNKPKLVPLAITLAIYGRHFYVVANQIK